MGAGFTGAVLAERIATQLGQSVVVIDRRSHIAGNAYDHVDQYGVEVHRYGPHIFHTNSAGVAGYLSRFTAWRPYEHKARGWVDGHLIPVPFNFTSMEMLFGESEGQRLNKQLADEYGAGNKVPILKMRASRSRDVRKIADIIYEKIFLHYNIKQWGVPPDKLDPSVSARVPVYLSYDDRYFQDTFQNMPSAGYTALFRRLLSHPLITIHQNIELKQILGSEKFDRLIFTGPMDEFFDYRHGALPYRSLQFDFKTTESEHPIQAVAQENYPTPAKEHAYTRTTEFRLLTGQDDVPFTTRAYEYPEAYIPGQNEPYYPIPCEDSRIVYRKYAADAAKLKAVMFAGRLADYKYYNMDQAVARALSCFEKEICATL